MNSKTLARLEKLETRLTPKGMPTLNLFMECSDIDYLPGLVANCELHNASGVCSVHHAVWIGPQSAAAQSMNCVYQPDKYKGVRRHE